jgi:NAD(P)-dependent dehydrogenase (short-subunit alcohol dehydrogenase family)
VIEHRGETEMGNLCEGRVVIVTGAGRGIGRSEALAFAKEGARVVVSDIGVGLDGSGGSVDVAEAVAGEIRELGGEAIAVSEDIGDLAGAERLVGLAKDAYGGLDVVVNNAGILRDKMIFNMEESDFDAVIRVHLKGTWNLMRTAAIYWRERSRAELENDARIVNTTSPSGLYGNVGQTNYSSAKAGIAAMSITGARELARYGVTVNAISPVARTRMTASISRPGAPPRPEPAEGEVDPRSPDFVAPLVVWLGSPESKDVTGTVFEVGAGSIGIAEGWRHGPSEKREGQNWEPSELSPVVSRLMAEAKPSPAI